VAKIQFGQKVQMKLEDGRDWEYWPWNNDPGDVPSLLHEASRAIGANYGRDTLTFEQLTTNPAERPVWYLSSTEQVRFSDAEIAKIREFLLNGGTLWADSCFGSRDFFESFKRELTRVFPDRKVYRLSLDHPVFHCFYEIKSIEYTFQSPDLKDGESPLWGMDIGCRTAVFLSQYGMSCGWDGHERKGAQAVKPAGARSIGVNMVAYCLSYFRLARSNAVTKVFYEEGLEPAGDFVFGQVSFQGNWDTHPNAIANLLKELAVNTSAEVKFQRRVVNLETSDILAYPFLYMSGHEDFRFSDREVESLRSYLNNGGFLFADSCCGRPAFDAAFRREMARVFPAAKLEAIQKDHPVFSTVFKIDLAAVVFDDYVGVLYGKTSRPPLLEGIQIAGTTPVVYSPYSLGCGWNGVEHPFCAAPKPAESLKLGVNVIAYFMTH